MAPVLTMHAKNDPTAFVELESAFKETVESAGNGDLLVQTFTDESEHSKLSTPQYAALFGAMVDWIEKGEKPTRQSVNDRCQEKSKVYKEECRFDTSYEPPALSTRSFPRNAD